MLVATCEFFLIVAYEEWKDLGEEEGTEGAVPTHCKKVVETDEGVVLVLSLPQIMIK